MGILVEKALLETPQEMENVAPQKETTAQKN